MANQIIYRRIDQSLNLATGLKNYEPTFGDNQDDFVADRLAVAQAVMTRLLLFQGEWWENPNDGLPLFQSILGQPANLPNIELVIRARIIGTPFVTGITNIQLSFAAQTRALQFYCVVNTQFGQIAIGNYPTPPSQGVS